MEEVFINPVTGEQFEGFSLKRSGRKLINAGRQLAGKTKLGRYGINLSDHYMDKANSHIPSRFRFDGEEDFDGFSLKKAFKQKEGGTLVGNIFRGVAQNAKGLIPGGQFLPIGDGLMLKKADLQAQPAAAVEMAQTPQQAAAVVTALAPNLTGGARDTAISAVGQANNTTSATNVASMLADLEAKKKAEAEKKKTAMIIGGSIFSIALISLIIWLIVRK